MKRNLFIPKTTLAFLMALFSVWGWGQTTYTFTSLSWGATPNSWTNGNSGNSLQSGRGIQVTTGTTGAYGNSPAFTNVSKVEVVYSTNASAGAGTLRVNSVSSATASANSGTQIGSTFAISSPASAGTTDKTATFTPTLPVSGNVQLYVTCSTNSIYIKSVTITTGSAGPTINANPNSLSNFTYVSGNGPSAQQSFSVSGSNLTSDITVTPSTNYEVSTTSGSGFTSTPFVLSQTSGSVSSTAIYTRLKAGLPVNSYNNESVSLSSTNATTVNVGLSGSVTAPVPTINATPTTLTGFTYLQGAGPSAEQSFSINGNNLSADITVTANTNYEVSTTSGSGFVNSFTLAQTAGNVSATTIYARLKSGLSAASYTGNIALTSTGATTTNVAVSGSVTVANDLCTNAETLIAGATVNGSLAGSTYSAPFTSVGTSGNDVWYKYTASNSGSHTFTVAGFTGDVDIELFDGSSCPTTATYIANATTTNASEIITFNLTSGTTYYVRVISYNVAANTSTFTVNLVAPTPCIVPSTAAALVLTPTSNSVGGSFTASSPAASGYFVVRSASATLSASPVNGTVYNVGDAFGGGTVIKYSAGATFSATGLSQSTNYYFFVYSYNNQCIGEPFYSSTSLNGNVSTVAGPCLNEVFSSNSTPNGWIDTFTGITYPGYADMAVENGSITTSALSFPSQLNFKLSRTGNSSAKTLNVQVSTTSQTSGFSTVATYTHSNTTSNGDTQITVDLTPYSAFPNVYVRFAKVSSTTSPWRIDNVEVFCTPQNLITTWNNGAWSNGTPSATVDAVISGTYVTSVTTPAFTAKNIIIQNGGTLEIATGNTVNAVDFTIEDGGNLIQRGDGGTNNPNGVLVYTGVFKANKNYATNVTGKYAFWSSPVQNQNMFTAFTPQTTDVTTYNTATNYYDAATNFTNNSGKGYSILMPVGGSAVFTGTPNNGNINVALSNASFGFNLVGNPYPSNLSLTSFLSSNSGNISPTIYFWDNTSAPVANQTGQTSANYGYATFNASGTGTWAPAQNISGGTGSNIDLTNATPQINPGQGFIVKSLNGNNLVFNNDMRVSATGTFVNKNGSNSSEGKYWLKLKTPLSAVNTLAITYGEGATNALEGFDSKAMALGSDAFYSKVVDNKLAIQGRADFVNTDVVPLGSKHFTDGLHTISLANKTGIFNNGQAIYLHDKVLGTYTNLQNTSYNFTVNAGEIADRFEVVYQFGTLSTSEAQKGSFEIYRDGNDFFARNSKNIDKIEVFDASGRKVQEITSGSQLVRIPLDSKGFYIIKAKSAGKEYTKKLTY